MGTLLRLKQYLTGTPPDAQYVCLACEARFEEQPQVCPQCGGYDIRRAEWTSTQSGESRPPEESA
jgi:rubrerythrin